MTDTTASSDASSELLLEPGTLWNRLRDRTQHGLDCGALQPIATNYEFIEDGGIRFLVRMAANLDRKAKAKKEQNRKTTTSGKDFNPFLPYEEDLFVADISQTHVGLLNKFNVVDHHLLIVTRAFEEQDTWLTRSDFMAMHACLAQVEGLAFYNGGTLAGASQRHKHLQLVPLPMIPDNKPIPIAEAIEKAEFRGAVGTVSAFPFVHAVGKLDRTLSPEEAATATLECYRTLLEAVGLDITQARPPQAYNFLATRDWMLVVPRTAECFESVSVNSLGFAGTLFVRNAEDLQRLKEVGPMSVLERVGRSLADRTS
ncbi:MAG: phosphorylase [Cyanobacteriota bacterium]|nr:phosphorylase [Cyanobacteriota bacterium]